MKLIGVPNLRLQNAIYENKKRMVGPRAGERGSQQLRRRHRMESIPGNFNVHLAAIEAPGCTTTSAASRTVSLDCQVQASIHRFNDKLYTSPLAQREPSIDRQGTRCAAPCCQELVMLAKEVAGGWSWRYRQASGFTLRRPQHKSCTCSEAAARSSEHSFT